MAQRLAVVSNRAEALAERFWPGPLTLILPALPGVPAAVTAGTGNIGIRWAEAVFAERLIGGMAGPVTATSANRSGMPSAVTADEVRRQLEGSLEILVDGGTLPTRSGSTVLDLTAVPARILREGPIPESAMADLLK
jgi:L-threonylcarbamoyladenylate synthase